MGTILNGLEMDRPCYTEWCWAAVASAIAGFYPPHPRITQCSIANSQIPNNNCQTKGGSKRCNIPQPLEGPLCIVGHLDQKIPNPTNPSQIISKTESSQPICVRIGWEGRSGHYVVIKGYVGTDPENMYLVISDPAYGECITPYKIFKCQYKSLGSWTDTYFTK
jgi:Papain-like cysteine protease AvrRpt2